MGQEAEKEARLQLFRDYSVDEAAMAQAAPDASCFTASRPTAATKFPPE